MVREGLLDEEGDLTSAALLMREDGEDAESRHLLAVADRFCLGIEIATLLPLIRAGVKTLLPFERELPPEIRDEVARRQTALKENCRDDLEFLFKLYHHWQLASKAALHRQHSGLAPSLGEGVSPLRQAFKFLPDERRGIAEKRLLSVVHRSELKELAQEFIAKSAERSRWLERRRTRFAWSRRRYGAVQMESTKARCGKRPAKQSSKSTSWAQKKKQRRRAAFAA